MLSAYPILQHRLKTLHNTLTQSKHNTMYHHISNVLLFFLVFFFTLLLRLLTLIPFVCANIFFHFHSTIAVFACFFFSKLANFTFHVRDLLSPINFSSAVSHISIFHPLLLLFTQCRFFPRRKRKRIELHYIFNSNQSIWLKREVYILCP